MFRNIILASDSYKHSHFLQYPPGTEHVSSYIEARRSGLTSTCLTSNHTQFFGIDAFIAEYLAPVSADDVDYAEAVLKARGLPFNRDGWEYIIETYEGYLPLDIQALPEGGLYPRGTALVQVCNTDPKVPWLTSFIETALLRAIWYPSTVATTSFAAKMAIYSGLLRSSDDPDGQIPFKLHDFGARGVSSSESAGLGGAAHLMNFKGTDTLEAIGLIKSVYFCDDMPGFSIPASEHSTMTSWGRDGEADAYQNMMKQFGGGLFSIVSDSYDLFAAINDIYGGTLKDTIMNLEGKLVVRPDSGNPVTTPVKVLNALWSIFGGTINSKGYKVLNPKVGVIQGDGMNLQSIGELVEAVITAGFSVDNIAFGMGGGLLQAHTRDDQRFAMKASALMINEKWHDVSKNPATDPTKASRAGVLAVVEREGEIVTIREDELRDGEENMLNLVYQEGSYLSSNWTTVTDRAHQALLSALDRRLLDKAA